MKAVSPRTSTSSTSSPQSCRSRPATRLFRERLSNEMWVPLDELDVGVGALIERIFDSLGSDNDQRAQESDR